MQKQDVESLLKFLERPGMYIHPTDRTNIISFIHGYEFATDGKCNFTEILSNILIEKYRIKYFATGWPDQIERYSGKNGMSWVESFFLLASETLSQHQP